MKTNETKQHKMARATDDIQGIVAALADTQQQIALLTKQVETHREKVVAYLAKKAADELTSADGKRLLATYHAHEMTRFQSKAFQLARPRLYDQFTETKEVHQLLLK